MSEKITKEMIVGDIVADNFNRAKVFEHLGIDYCCGGKITLEEACRKKDLDPDKVIAQIETPVAEGDAPNFSEWPLDLLVDYILKKHHRNFHLHHEELLSLVKKVENAHGGHHPELHEVRKEVEE